VDLFTNAHNTVGRLNYLGCNHSQSLHIDAEVGTRLGRDGT